MSNYPFVPIAPSIVLALLLAIGCGDTAGGAGPNNGLTELRGTDPAGDQVCESDTAEPEPEMDITAVDITDEGSTVTTVVTFNGDTETYAEETLDDYEGLEFSLQLYLADGTYIEAFFADKTHMKVADGKADVTYTLKGGKLTINLTGNFLVGNIESARVSTFVYGQRGGGSCDDDIELKP